MVGSKKKKKKKVCYQHFVLNIHKKFKGERERERYGCLRCIWIGKKTFAILK